MTETADAPVTETTAPEPDAAPVADTEPAPAPEVTPEERARRAAYAEARRYKRDIESRMAARERELAAEREALMSQSSSATKLVERLKSGDLLEALHEIGVTPEQLVDHLTAAASESPEQRRIAKELRELRQEREREQKERAEREEQARQQQARQQLYTQVSDAVDAATDARLVRLKAENPDGVKEFARAVAIRAEAALKRGERVVLNDVAEAVWADARRTYDLARIAFRDEDGQPVTATPPTAAKGKPQPPRPGAGTTTARGKSLSELPTDKAISALLSMSEAELEQLAKG